MFAKRERSPPACVAVAGSLPVEGVQVRAAMVGLVHGRGIELLRPRRFGARGSGWRRSGEDTGSQGRGDRRHRSVGESGRQRPRRVGGAGRPSRNRARAVPAPGRDAGENPRPDRDPALGKRQGQSVLPARLQSRPRDRFLDVSRGYPPQPANPRARAGISRRQLFDLGAGRGARVPQRFLLRGRRRFLLRRYFQRRIHEQHRPSLSRGELRRIRLLPRRGWRLAPAARRRSAARRRGAVLRRTVEPRREPREVQRFRQVDVGRRRARSVALRQRLLCRLGLYGPDPAARCPRGAHRSRGDA